MSILSGPAILMAHALGDIEIDPFQEEMMNPASVDLTLGSQFLMYDVPSNYPPHQFHLELDARVENKTTQGVIPEAGIILRPNVGYLMHTVERVGSRRYVPVLDGKSSMGRLFIQVHATAGYGDPGFFGQWTLEVTVTYPVRVYPGMRIAQMRFHEMVGAVRLYEGNYKGDATGPIASRAWRQFEPLRREES
jgi:deoxycytidine triphosphate deaminase